MTKGTDSWNSEFNRMDWRVCKKRTKDPKSNCMNPWHTFHRTVDNTVYWSNGNKVHPADGPSKKWWKI